MSKNFANFNIIIKKSMLLYRNYFLRFWSQLLKSYGYGLQSSCSSYGYGYGSKFLYVMVPVPTPYLDHKKHMHKYLLKCRMPEFTGKVIMFLVAKEVASWSVFGNPDRNETMGPWTLITVLKKIWFQFLLLKSYGSGSISISIP